MIRNRTIVLAVLSLLAIQAHFVRADSDQEPIRFARTPDISPDGEKIAFSYLGDIWMVDRIGGIARPVTLHARGPAASGQSLRRDRAVE